jgi:hypothetical protein
MRKLKTTMLFLGISVTSFAQNFEGLDSVSYEKGEDLFITKVKNLDDALTISMRVIENNGIDTSSVIIERDSEVPIYIYWDDQKNRDRVYLFFCHKNKEGGYNVAVLHKDNVYSKFTGFGKIIYEYVPK